MPVIPKDRRTHGRKNAPQRLPHERDETAAPQEQAAPRGVMEQAADDLAQGLVDTDLHGQRGIENVVQAKHSGQARPHANAGSGMRHTKS
jgi:hypothetical protein